MAIVSDSLIYNLLIGALFILGCLYYYFTSKFEYWRDRGVVFVKPIPFFGNVKDQILRKKSMVEMYNEIYKKLSGNRFGGFFEFREPVLMIRDPALVEAVLIKDFSHFYDRPFIPDTNSDPLTANLFNLKGAVWKNLRNKLTPTFTTGKLKTMTEQILKSGEKLVQHLAEESKEKKDVDSKSVISCFSLEVIASVAFGLQMDKDSEDGKNFRRFTAELMTPSLLVSLRLTMMLYAPKVAAFFKIKQFPKSVQDATVGLVRDTLNYRTENNVQRNDFIQLLLNIRKQELDGNFKITQEQEEDELIDQMKYVPKPEVAEANDDKIFMTDMHITAQSLIFLVAGLEAVSTSINFALYTLMENPKVQDKVHEEIDHVMKNHNNVWSYQAVKEMTYLDEVIQEGQRLYPQTPALFRLCTEDYQIPDSEVIIRKGTRLIIPLFSIMRDQDNYDSPEVFDPSRFQDNNYKPNGKYMPFGDGPRVCIAMRFAILEVKVGLAKMMSEFRVKSSAKMKSPMVFEKSAFGVLPVGGFWFEFEKRK